MRTLQFLLLEDSSIDAELITATLKQGGIEFDLTVVQTRDSFTAAIATTVFDLILTDYSLPSFDGLSALKIARQQCPETPVIFVSASLGEELAIETIKSGATDYVLKQRLWRLVPSVHRALRESSDHRNRLQTEQALSDRNQRLKLLFETTRDLLSTTQPLTLMNSLFRRLSAQMDLHGYYNFLVAERDNKPMLKLACYNGISQDSANAIEWIEFGQAACGLVALERRQIVINNVQGCSHAAAQLICSLGVTAYAGQPLIVQGRLLGTLSFMSFTRTSFTPEEVALLQATSDQVAVALERSELMASLRRQTEQLTEANRIKDEFLAVLSHELRTPLNPILGWARLLQSKQHSQETVLQALETIERNAKMQSQLIDDMLDVSRIFQGKLSLKVNPVDLVSVIKAAYSTVELAAEAKSLQIHTCLSPDVGLVLGDPVRLQQILWNLLSNAVKFTPNGGQIYVTLTQVDPEMTLDQTQFSSKDEELKPTGAGFRMARIQVSDTGKGITPGFLPQVFDYFRQAESSTTRSFGGLGLGLAIVRHLVEMHGGTVRADSAGEGQGALFTIDLPLMTMPSQTSYESEATGTGQDLTGVQILVVDDEVDSLDLTTFILQEAGASVTAVSSAEEALKALEQARVDVLVCDIGMPRVDGYMLLQQVQSQFPDPQRTAIALTAYAGEINQQQALSAGFKHHLTKPVEPIELVNVVANMARSVE